MVVGLVSSLQMVTTIWTPIGTLTILMDIIFELCSNMPQDSIHCFTVPLGFVVEAMVMLSHSVSL